MLIDGRRIQKEILEELKTEVSVLEKIRGALRMAAVLMGNEPELKKFVELKKNAAHSAGIGFKEYFFPKDISERDLIEEIRKISADPEIQGVFVELPLPEGVNRQNVLDAIPLKKDPDVLSQAAQEKYYAGDFSVLPPAVQAVKIIFDKFAIDPAEKNVAIFGYGLLIGRPLAYWLQNQRARVSVIRSKTENPGELSKEADIVISGVGKPGVITGDMIKTGAMVIDFGYGKKDGKMMGDVDLISVESKTNYITPVPGGMGPVLIAAVLKNLVLLNS